MAQFPWRHRDPARRRARTDQSRIGKHRKSLRRRSKARFDERGKGETGSRPDLWLHRAHGVAGCTIRN